MHFFVETTTSILDLKYGLTFFMGLVASGTTLTSEGLAGAGRSTEHVNGTLPVAQGAVRILLVEDSNEFIRFQHSSYSRTHTSHASSMTISTVSSPIQSLTLKRRIKKRAEISPRPSRLLLIREITLEAESQTSMSHTLICSDAAGLDRSPLTRLGRSAVPTCICDEAVSVNDFVSFG